MTVAGALAILLGWLLIAPVQRRNRAGRGRARRALRIALAVVGTWMVTAGMAAVVQARH